MASDPQNRETRIEIEGERELLEELSAKKPVLGRLSSCLKLFQHSCSLIVKHPVTVADPATPDYEAQIWDAHLKINSRFRKLLSQFRNEQTRKERPVEERKLKQQYQRFISGAQNLYNGYLEYILGRIIDMPEIAEAAAKLQIAPSPKARVDAPEISKELRNTILDSCYSTFIRLGDLSRYFQTELVSDPQKREWDHVAKYYRLAGSIKPYSGIFHNQLAIISLAEADHLQATYYLYRALCATEPHPTADGNLQIEFRKIFNAWKNGKLIENKDELESLIARFTYLHAMLYKGVDFADHDELEDDILDQLAIRVKASTLDSDLLQKLCLVNIAAEAHAQTKPETNEKAPKFFQRLNVKTFLMLLQVLLAEKASLSQVVYTILPALRHYSSWLVINSISLPSESQDSLLGAQSEEFWRIYASTLTLLNSTFRLHEIPVLNYLLPEDTDIVGFFPLMHNGKSRRLFDEEGNLKPKKPKDPSDEDVRAEPSFRVRELVVDCLDLIVRLKIPIRFRHHADATVIFLYEGDDEPPVSKTGAPTSAAQEDIPLQQQDDRSENQESNSVSEPDSLPPYEQMNKMVEELVSSEEDPAENLSSARVLINLKPWISSLIDTNGGPSTYQHRSLETSEWPHSPTVAPEPVQPYSPVGPLPSIMNSPFALRPVRLPSPSLLLVSPGSRPSTANRTSMHMSLGSDDFSAARSNHAPFQHSNLCSTPIMMSQDSNSNGYTPTQVSNVDSDYWQPARSFIERIDCIGIPNSYYQRQATSPFNASAFSHYALNGSYATSSARAVRAVGQTPPSGQGG